MSSSSASESRRRRVGRARWFLPLVVVCGALVAASLAGCRGSSSSDRGSSPATTGGQGDASGIEAYRGAGWVGRENARPGTTAWQVSADRATWDRIRGFANRTSVDWGEPFDLHVD